MEFGLFLLTLAIAAVGGIIGYKLKLPAGAMLGAMIAVIIFNISTEKAVFPSDLRTVVQLCSGAMIGSGIKKKDVFDLKKIVFPIIIMILCMIVLNVTFGTIMFYLSNLNLATTLFATAPGGMTDMAIISADLGANSAYVALLQLFRLMVIYIVIHN